jgi:predicted phage-related endonuclease
MSKISEVLRDRRRFIGGSDARIIMGDDEAALVRLWREKRGEAQPEDLSGNLIVQLGTVTEALNRRWYEANTGQAITDVQRHVKHASLGWMAATLDGRIHGSEAVFEAKFMLPWSFSEEAAVRKHMPQLQHICWDTGSQSQRPLPLLSGAPAARPRQAKSSATNEAGKMTIESAAGGGPDLSTTKLARSIRRTKHVLRN